MTEDLGLGAGLTCFVIGPIGSKLSPLGTPARVQYEDSIQVWEAVFEPACATFGLSPLRADKLSQPGEITEQIFVLLRDADIVIADVSGGNPNVMYELGLRHSRDKITVQLGEYERLPFDVNTIRTIQFKRSEAGLIDARDGLVGSLRAALDGRGSPVSATRIWNDAAPPTDAEYASAAARSAESDADDSAETAPGFVDLLAEGEAAITQTTTVLTETTATLEEISRVSESSRAMIDNSDSRNRGFAGRLAVARTLAGEFKEPSARLEELATKFHGLVETTDAMMQYILLRSAEDPQELHDAGEFLASIVDMANSSEEAAVAFTDGAIAARNMAKISRDLREPSKTIERAMNRIVQGINTILEWRSECARLLELPDSA